MDTLKDMVEEAIAEKQGIVDRIKQTGVGTEELYAELKTLADLELLRELRPDDAENSKMFNGILLSVVNAINPEVQMLVRAKC